MSSLRASIAHMAGCFPEMVFDLTGLSGEVKCKVICAIRAGYCAVNLPLLFRSVTIIIIPNV